jgi:hypothetical protein
MRRLLDVIDRLHNAAFTTLHMQEGRRDMSQKPRFLRITGRRSASHTHGWFTVTTRRALTVPLVTLLERV